MNIQRHVFILLLSMCCFLTFHLTTAHAAEPHYVIGTETTNVPFGMQSKDGSYNGKHPGIDPALLKAIAKKEHFTYDLKVMSFTAIVQAVQGNQVDGAMTGLMINPERKRVLDFSHPYINASLSLVSVPGTSIKGLSGLRGKTLAVKTGSTSEVYAQSIQKKYGFTIRHCDSSNTVFNDVVAGNVDAALDMTVSIKYSIKNGMKMHIISTPNKANKIGFAVKKGTNQALLRKFNAGLAAIKKDGTYDKIVGYYIGKHSHVVKNVQQDRSFLGLIKSNASEFGAGIALTLKLAVVAIIIAAIVGILIGLLGVLPNRGCRYLFDTYTFIFRSVPLMVLAFFIYIGLPSLTGQKIPLFPAGVISLVLENSAYIAIFVCGGIQQVDQGQTEASRSLGVSYLSTMRKVVLPQAIRMMIPSFINQFIMVLKGTSILSAIGLAELTQQGTMIIARNMEGFKIWLIVAVIYLILIGILTWLSHQVSKHYQLIR